MKSKINQLLNAISAGLMIFFALPKLLGAEKSKSGFSQFETALQFDADIFRVFTGVTELIIAVLIVIYAFNKNKMLGKVGYFMLYTTMISALMVEFVARPTPQFMLVSIAVFLASVSVYRVNTIN